MRTATLAFLAGSVLALNLPAPPPVLGTLALLAALGAAVRWPRLRVPAFAAVGALWTGLAAGAAAAGALPEALEGEDLVLVGRIEDVPAVRGPRLRLRLGIERVEGGPPAARALVGAAVRLSWYSAPTRPRAGERWRLAVRLRRARGFANPGGFDFEAYALARGLAAVGYVRTDARNTRVDAAPWWSLGARRQALAERLEAVGEPGPANAVVKALALGVREDLSSEQWAVLRATGTAHLIAISGLHVGLVAWLAGVASARLWACSARLATWLPAPRAAVGVALVAATGYAALAGFSVPTRRALVMLAVLAAARLMGRRVATSSVLALACLAVMLLDPLAVASTGFWLSFCAVAAIAFGCAARLGPRSGDGRGAVLWWRWGRVHPLVALGVAPASLLLIGDAAPLAPLANALAVPWVSMLVVPPSILAALVVSVWPAAAAALVALASAALDLLWPTLELLAALAPGPAPPRPGAWALGLAALGFALVALPAPTRARWLGVCCLAPLVLAAAPALAPGALAVTVLDVGQGLSVVVRSASAVLVYDAGARWRGGLDAGRDVVARHLESRGVRRLAELVVSHGDVDHAGGAAGLRAALDVGEAIGDAGLAPPRSPCVHGRRWRRDGLRYTLLRVEGAGTDNDRSCVLRIDTPGGTVVLPGDIEAPAEGELVAHLDGAAPLALLVAPHHGSATSSTRGFLEALRPRHVAVSAGHRNRFGFPDPKVLARLDAVGATVQTTGRCGAIEYLIAPGEPVSTRCWREARWRPWR